MKLSIIFLVLFISTFISTLIIAVFSTQHLESNSIIFERINRDLNFINNKVKLLSIAHSKIPIPFIQFFSEGFASHWSICIIDENDNIYVLSISSYRSVIVSIIKKSTLRRLDDKHYVFIGFKHKQHIINENEIYLPKDNITINDILKRCVHISKIHYELFNHNCQYQVVMTLKPFIKNSSLNHNLPNLLTKRKLLSAVITETFSPKCLKLKSKNKSVNHLN